MQAECRGSGIVDSRRSHQPDALAIGLGDFHQRRERRAVRCDGERAVLDLNSGGHRGSRRRRVSHDGVGRMRSEKSDAALPEHGIGRRERLLTQDEAGIPAEVPLGGRGAVGQHDDDVSRLLCRQRARDTCNRVRRDDKHRECEVDGGRPGKRREQALVQRSNGHGAPRFGAPIVAAPPHRNAGVTRASW